MSEQIQQTPFDFPYYYVELGLPNHTFRMPHRSKLFQQLQKDHQKGDLEKRYPRERDVAPSNKTTAEMHAEMEAAKGGGKLQADERGDFKTDDPEEAVYAFNSVATIPGCNPRFHPNSMKLPPEWSAKLAKIPQFV